MRCIAVLALLSATGFPLGQSAASNQEQQVPAAPAAAAQPVAPEIADAEAAIVKSDWSAAEAKLTPYIATHPDDARALFDAGYVADAQNRLNDAASLYRRAVEANPQSFEARLSLGLLLARLPRQAQATGTGRVRPGRAGRRGQEPPGLRGGQVGGRTGFRHRPGGRDPVGGPDPVRPLRAVPARDRGVVGGPAGAAPPGGRRHPRAGRPGTEAPAGRRRRPVARRRLGGPGPPAGPERAAAWWRACGLARRPGRAGRPGYRQAAVGGQPGTPGASC